MASYRQYKNPPIEEAVCEIRFASPPWEITWPGQLFELIKRDFPGKPRLQQQSMVTVEPGIGLTVRPEAVKTQFVSADEKQLVALGPGSFSVHSLRPYGGWESFATIIQKNLSAFLEIAQNIDITRLGIRYINKIQLPGESVELSEFFSNLPSKSGNLPDSIASFFARIDFALPGKESIVRVTFANGNIESGNLVVLLDIDAIWERADLPMRLNVDKSVGDLAKMLNELKVQERNVFEALITEKTRQVFDAQVSAV